MPREAVISTIAQTGDPSAETARPANRLASMRSTVVPPAGTRNDQTLDAKFCDSVVLQRGRIANSQMNRTSERL